MQAQAELEHLRSLTGNSGDDDQRHWEINPRAPTVQNRNAQSYCLSD
jgi:hypothetical protein